MLYPYIIRITCVFHDRAEYIAILIGVYLTIWTINISPLTVLYKALSNIIGGKGAISNINHNIIIINNYFCIELC